ncbi:DEAD/DEAH box helicase [Akkermansiaceae bacterium]|nr:DEAD/DEAH box helicase [Akkermansiaceae bacterium]
MNRLPRHFEELAEADFPDRKIVDIIIDPVLFVQRSGKTNIATLCGKILKKGRKNLIKTHSLEHSWIDDGVYLRPLPSDISKIIASFLEGIDPSNISYPQLLSLEKKIINYPLELEISEEILELPKIACQKYSVPSKTIGLQAKLYPYQEQGVAWMDDTLDRFGGLILADEMGLGKTLQIITLFLLKPPTNNRPALVVCPTSLLANWGNELDKFAPQISWAIHRGEGRARIYTELNSSQLLITTYETLVNDQLLLSSIEWTHVVFDEAQALKNPQSARRIATTLLERDFTIPVTGTPVETSLLDLWSLADLAIPGILGEQEDFLVNYPDSFESAESLSRLLNPIILRRNLGDVAEQLPERTNIEVPLSLGRGLDLAYEQTRSLICDEYPKAGQLVASGQLALFCAHPWLSTKDPTAENWEENVSIKKDDGFGLITPKVETCIDLISRSFKKNQKVIIFAAYNNVGDILQEAGSFSQAYWNSINGSTPGEVRQTIVDEFTHYDGNAILVLNPKAAGAGLNIQAATVVIHFTQYWNPALEAQASARAHRTGQKNPVDVYYLYYENTIERIMLDRVEFRREIAKSAVPIALLDEDHLNEALSISPISHV